LDNGADIESPGWIQISKIWKFVSPLELAFQLQSEKDSSAGKKSFQNLIKVLLEKQKQMSINMSQEGEQKKILLS
jgi:hypothetical protein